LSVLRGRNRNEHNPVEQLTVAGTAPAMPLVLADTAFMSTLAQVEEQIGTMKVSDQQSAQAAANLQVRLTTAGKKLNDARLGLNRPFAAIIEKINDAARGPQARIEEAKEKLKLMLNRYEAEQRRIAQEAEDKRQAEIARLEKIRQEEEAERKRKADELAGQIAKAQAEAAAKAAAEHKAAPVPIVELDFGDEPAPIAPQTETEKQLDALKFAPPALPVIPLAGVASRQTLLATVTDANLLPDMFVEKIPKLKAIMSVFCSGWKEGMPIPTCPGVAFTVKRDTVSTGRARF
jgi:hypothetical protein